jgi:hypothetical protein
LLQADDLIVNAQVRMEGMVVVEKFGVVGVGVLLLLLLLLVLVVRVVLPGVFVHVLLLLRPTRSVVPASILVRLLRAPLIFVEGSTCSPKMWRALLQSGVGCRKVEFV